MIGIDKDSFSSSHDIHAQMTEVKMGTENHKEDRNSPEYLSQLLKDKKQIQAFPNVFVHLERLLDEGKHFRNFKEYVNYLIVWEKLYL